MTNRMANLRQHSRAPYDYSQITTINGTHPWQADVPGGHVLYRARKRKHGRVAWFNFDLAKDMGLIPQHHPEELNHDLERTLLDTFAIQIINEYDLINGTKIDPADVKPNFYMATRYLQLQHPGRTGLTSGDGRSIWNGVFKNKHTTWDISSCGTGATCLSPATHKYKKFFRTGDPAISYGCGYSDLDDGIMGSIFSEILHRNGIPTERCLLVIEFPGNLSINVRAGKNLLRPSHFFNHLKQGNLPRLKAAIDFFIGRQLSNKAWPALKHGENRYKRMLAEICDTFATMAARFESEYIFCWLAWDGDNILADGGIIDYGSIRQFGLFHHEYRFDDVDRWSTTITEQREQARNIVQVFAQIENYINTGKKRPISAFRKHPELKRFDQIFAETKQRLMLEKTGFTTEEAKHLMSKHRGTVNDYQKAFTWFERQTKKTGKPYRVADGLTRDALYSMRDILREIPKHFLRHGRQMTNHEFMKSIASSYCSKKDAQPTREKNRWILRFQNTWQQLVTATAAVSKQSQTTHLKQLAGRCSIINRYERVTGDAICHVGEKVLRGRKQLTRREVYALVDNFVEDQILVPEHRTLPVDDSIQVRGKSERIMRAMIKSVKSHRDGL